MDKVAVIIPAYNESRTIGAVIESLREISDLIIVVDDGSVDGTGEIARNSGTKVLRHFVNRGLGAGLQTGFKKALLLEADYVVTFDADGQHRASDIPRLLEPLRLREAEVAIGSRKYSQMPFLRRLYNTAADLMGFLFFGVYVHDTQSGLRAFKKEALAQMRPLGDRMEISSEIIGEVKRLGFRIKEVPVEPIYTEYSMSKGQSLVTGFKTLLSFIIHRLGR